VLPAVPKLILLVGHIAGWPVRSVSIALLAALAFLYSACA